MTDDELRSSIRAHLRTAPADARPFINRMLRHARTRNDPSLAAEAAFWRAESAFAAGNVAGAARAYDEAWQYVRTRPKSRLRVPVLVGRIQTHGQLGHPQHLDSMARMLRRGMQGKKQAALVESAIGTSYTAAGNDARAEECFRSALGLLARQRDPAAKLLRAKARHNLAIRIARRGRVAEALRELDIAAEELRELGQHAWSSRIDHNRGWLLGLLGRSGEAFELLNATRVQFELEGNTRSAGMVLRDEAALLLRLGSEAEAAEHARAATKLLPPVEAARARLLAARALRNRQPARARQLARTARKALDKVGDAAGVATADTLLGTATTATATALRKRGHFIGALEALLASQPTTAQLKRAITAYPQSLRRWVTPEIERRLARGKNRIAGLRRAFRAAEALRLLAPTALTRAQSLLSHRAIYEEFATALIERGRAADRREAFLVIDALRARTLRDQAGQESPALHETNAEIAKLRTQLEAMWRQVEHDEERGGDLRRAQPSTQHSLETMERALRHAISATTGATATTDRGLPKFAVLSFAVLGDRVVGLFSARGQVEVVCDAALDDVRELTAAFSFQVQRRLHGEVPEKLALQHLERLSAMLLGSQTWSGPIGIVVEPELGSVPFELLPALADAEPFHLPWAGVPRQPRRSAGRPLVVGFGPDALPEVSHEVRDVSRRLGNADVLSGSAATRESVLASLSARPIIHIAGHAATNPDLPLLSGLRTANGWITAADFALRQFRGSVVVLSGCRTGDPAQRWEGEAFAGFSRALLASGAAAVLATRWEIRDSAARAWMSHFYTHLQDGSLHAALRRSMLQVRKKFPHPADWGAFVLISHGRPA